MNNLLELTNVCKSFNNKIVLDDLNLNIKYKDFYGLLGINGSGKSTIVKIISGIITKYSGNIKLFGLDYEKNKNFIKSKIGIVPQEFNFNPFETVYNTLLYKLGYCGFDIKNKKIDQIINECLLKLNIQNIKNSKVYTLSGGNKRKLLIAQSIIHNPEFLILDEPSVGLDIYFKEYLLKIFKELNNKITLLIITHHMNDIKFLCNNIGILKNGKINNLNINDIKSKIENNNYNIYTSFIDKDILIKLKKFNAILIGKNIINIKVKLNYDLNKIFFILNKYKVKIFNIKINNNIIENTIINNLIN